MIKSSFLLFFICFLLYLPFSRTPDYFDSETIPALVEYKGTLLVASFKEKNIKYNLVLDEQAYKKMLGKRVEVIYELSQPQHVKLNKLIGYWLIANEILWSLGIFILLMAVAYATTHRPEKASLEQQLNVIKEDKSKYQ